MKDFNWEEFKEYKIAVHCDTEEKAKDFLDNCDENEIYYSGIYKKDTCYSYYDGIGYTNRLCCCSLECYKQMDYKIIEWQFDNKSEGDNKMIKTKITEMVKENYSNNICDYISERRNIMGEYEQQLLKRIKEEIHKNNEEGLLEIIKGLQSELLRLETILCNLEYCFEGDEGGTCDRFGDKYYYINQYGNIQEEINTRTIEEDMYCGDDGNYFKTIEEAIKSRNEDILLTELKKFAKDRAEELSGEKYIHDNDGDDAFEDRDEYCGNWYEYDDDGNVIM